MAKFVIECPQCGRYQQASTSLFAKKKIDCTCGYTILVKSDKMASKICPHCGNTVVFDQSKGEKAICPVCKNKINTSFDQSKSAEISCPTCGCMLTTDKNATTYDCPLCDTSIDVQKALAAIEVKKNKIASIIKYEGGNDIFVWKHPLENFNYGSQLIVHESQEAIFFRDGKALDLFGPGKYTLDTNNLPVMNKLYQATFNSNDLFHSEVYFINMATHMGIKWGTDSKVRLFDPASGLHIELGASGQFNLKVSDSRRLLIKLVGTTSELRQNESLLDGLASSSMMSKFKALIMNKVKANLAKSIKEKQINILEIDEYLDVLSEDLKIKINDNLTEYGLMMPEFYITTILTPDDDPNFKRLKQQFAEKTLRVRQENILKDEAEAARERKIVEARTEAELKILEAQGDSEALRIKARAEAEEMQLKGYTYQQETQRQVGLEAMKNLGTSEGGGSIISDFAKLGIGLGTVSTVANITKDTINSQPTNPNIPMPNAWDCKCGQKNITTNFCPNCGTKKPSANTWDCECGQKNITTNFCPNCGTKRPSSDTWDCKCGQKNITTNFCPNCGGAKVK